MRTLEPTLLTVPLSLVYEIAARGYHACYDRGLLKPVRLPVPVVSIGNLVVGGTGKTPAVEALAAAFRDQGLVPAVLTRGYGGTRKGRLRDGRWVSGEVAGAEAGDEPLVLSRRLPGVTIGIDPHRARMAAEILAHQRVDVFVLDDGFQHRRLGRDLNVLLLDARSPFGNGRLLPAGPLRESPQTTNRADIILVTGLADTERVPEASQRAILSIAPHRPMLRTYLVLEGFESLLGEPRPHPGGPVFLAAGIARPERFQTFLNAQGLQTVGHRWFPDHHPFTRAEIDEVEREAARLGATLVTTAKDAVRVEPHARAEWLVASVRLEVEGGWGDLLTRYLPSLSAPAKK